MEKNREMERIREITGDLEDKCNGKQAVKSIGDSLYLCPIKDFCKNQVPYSDFRYCNLKGVFVKK